jgi:hypothetical protein
MVARRVLPRRRATASGARILLKVGFLGALGCGTEDEVGPTERYCEALCARAVECGLADGSCKGICEESADVGPLRDDVAEQFASCISSQACYDLTSEETSAACWDQLEGSVPVTEYGRKFCVAYATHAFSCGYELGTRACEASYGIFADEALERLVACTDEPCERLEACQDGALWGEP